MDSCIEQLALILVLTGIGMILYPISNFSKPIITRAAKVTGKRAQVFQPTSESPVRTKYFATFETDNGERVEYLVWPDVYASLADNDIGYLHTQGTRFLGFEREPIGR